MVLVEGSNGNGKAKAKAKAKAKTEKREEREAEAFTQPERDAPLPKAKNIPVKQTITKKGNTVLKWSLVNLKLGGIGKTKDF